MDAILSAILDDDRPRVKKLLKAGPRLATRLIDAARLYESKIVHWIYVGDTALHLAAAGYRVELVRLLLAAGADPNSTMNHPSSIGPRAVGYEIYFLKMPRNLAEAAAPAERQKLESPWQKSAELKTHPLSEPLSRNPRR